MPARRSTDLLPVTDPAQPVPSRLIQFRCVQALDQGPDPFLTRRDDLPAQRMGTIRTHITTLPIP